MTYCKLYEEEYKNVLIIVNFDRGTIKKLNYYLEQDAVKFGLYL